MIEFYQRKLGWLRCTALLLSATAFAQNKAAPRAAVLDFEGDRIGGERSGPFQSFLQGAQGPSFDSLLYLRKDFNDFQNAEYRKTGKPGRQRSVRERILFRRESGDFSR